MRSAVGIPCLQAGEDVNGAFLTIVAVADNACDRSAARLELHASACARGGHDVLRGYGHQISLGREGNSRNPGMFALG